MTRIAAAVMVVAAVATADTASDTTRQSWPSAGIRRVWCLTRNGSIEVRAQDTSRIGVEAIRRAGAKDRARLLLAQIKVSVRVEKPDSTLVVEAEMPDSRGVEASFVLVVPRVMDLELRTSMGGIRVESATGLVKAGVDLGGIELQRTSGRADLECGLGPVYLQDHSGPARVRVETGPVECVLRKPGAADTVDLASDAGPMKVFVPEAVPARLDARCSLGKVTVQDLPVVFDANSDTAVTGWVGPEGETNRVVLVDCGKGDVLVTGDYFVVESDILKKE